MSTHFKIIVPMYNVERWAEATIVSVKEQDYDNFQCIVADDMSTDNTLEIVKAAIGDDSRFKLISNTEKKYALKNILDSIEVSEPTVEDVIVNLDGDDWFPHRSVLSFVSSVYEKEDVWLTYGNHMNWPDIEPPWSLFPYPQDVVEQNSFRDFRYLASHLRTFKYGLLPHIKKEDFCDDRGEYFSITADLALMFPLCELAGKRSKFLDKILYVYNNHNPLNDWRKNPTGQKGIENLLRNRERYQSLEKL